MSSRYNRYLLSTCLSLAALAVCVPKIANAGFEWTPPEKVDPPVEIVPVPDMNMPVPPAPVEGKAIDETNGELGAIDELEEEPAIEVIVVDDDSVDDDLSSPTIASEKVVENSIAVEDSKADAKEDIIVIVVEEDNESSNISSDMSKVEADDVEDVKTVTATTKEAQSKAFDADDGVAENDHNSENVVIEVDDVEVMEPPAKNVKSSLTINPYPLGEDFVEESKEEVINWNVPESYEIIEGFGKDMPLALALRQIVPAKYAFSFGSGVNPGARVSWQGGKPWNEVLADATSKIGVKSAIKGKKILLSVDESFVPVSKEDDAKKVEHKKVNISKADNNNMNNVVNAKEGGGGDDSLLVVDDTKSLEKTIENDGKEKSLHEGAEVEKTKEDIDIQTTSSPEGEMNDALREVYGDSSPKFEGDIFDNSSMDLDETIDSNDDNNNEMVEDLIDPVDIVKGNGGDNEDEVAEPAFDAVELSPDNENVNDVVIDRENIMDPGENESVQPNILEEEGVLIEQKKN